MGNISTKYARGEQVRSENAVILREDLHGPDDAVTIRQGLDGPEDTVTVREEVDESEERVTIREESNSINSNEQVVERHTEQNLTGANTKGLRNRNILISVLVVCLVAALVALVAALVALPVKLHLAKRNAESLATQVLKLSTDLNADLRISTENISCERPSCIICKTEVMPHFEALHFEALHCAVSVKNGSCIMCGGKCMTLQGLLDKVKQNETHACKKPKIELTCCILAIVGNLLHHCEEGGYLCYNKTVHDHHNQSVHEPVCRCPPGSRSEHCKKPYTEAADCRCFRSTRKFYGQKQITHCDNVTANWSTCHMTRSELGEQYNCLCNKATGTDDHSLQCTPSDSDSTKDLG